MKPLKIILLLLVVVVISASGCKKDEEPGPDDFYFRCKIDGRLYIPNSCANCMRGLILRDTVLLLSGNAGYESVLMGINDGTGIAPKNYILNGKIGRQGGYDNSTQVNDIFATDSIRTGNLNIIGIDKSNRIIQGNFYFKAYNTNRDDSVLVTDGKFRLRYTIN